jgi:glycosyltransferase involved in cell wall biosynthesis
MKKYLKTFLEDLPNQTFFKQMEVVLDHNEPDEEEMSWVKDFQEKYPGKIKHIVVLKVDPIGTSINRCIEKSSGEYLTIWNVDDLRTPDSIEKQVKTLESGCDITYGDYKIVREFGSHSGKVVVHKDIPESEFTRSMIFGPFLMFKKNLCERAGYFDEQLKSGADFDMSIRLAFNGKAKMTEGLLGYYLNEGKGASTKPGSRQELERTMIEMRYGILDKIDYDYIPKMYQFNIPNILSSRGTDPVSKFVPNYHEIMTARTESLSKSGYVRHAVKKFIHIKDIKRILKSAIKNIR